MLDFLRGFSSTPGEMNFRVSIAVGCVMAAASPTNSPGQESSAYLSSKGTSAVDAKGVRHRAPDHPGTMPPWMADRVKSVAPDYPYVERARHHVGVGYFRLILDLKTGTVSNVIVEKSTGFQALDNGAVAAFRQWRWRPGKWKEVDTPCKFELGYGAPRLPPGSARLPPK